MCVRAERKRARALKFEKLSHNDKDCLHYHSHTLIQPQAQACITMTKLPSLTDSRGYYIHHSTVNTHFGDFNPTHSVRQRKKHRHTLAHTDI